MNVFKFGVEFLEISLSLRVVVDFFCFLDESIETNEFVRA